ncbi:MAG: hypothetical protein ABJA02_09295 [Acidobacteriota bacterium]
MKSFKTLLSLHTVQLILITVIAIIYLAIAATHNSIKTGTAEGVGSIAKDDSVTSEEAKSWSNEQGEFIIVSHVDYDNATELDNK